MTDDPKKTGLDRKLIALDEPHEVRSWTESLGCTEGELVQAVHAVGNSADKVREYLAQQRRSRTVQKALRRPPAAPRNVLAPYPLPRPRAAPGLDLCLARVFARERHRTGNPALGEW